MKNLLSLFIVFCFISCYSPSKEFFHKKDFSYSTNESAERIPLQQRGWSKPTRVFYADKKLKTAPERIKQAFIDKKLTKDMTKNLVHFMLGQVNAFKDDSIWVYLDQNNDTLLKIYFESDKVSKWAETRKKNK
jgi:hypothetical protein